MVHAETGVTVTFTVLCRYSLAWCSVSLLVWISRRTVTYKINSGYKVGDQRLPLGNPWVTVKLLIYKHAEINERLILYRSIHLADLKTGANQDVIAFSCLHMFGSRSLSNQIILSLILHIWTLQIGCLRERFCNNFLFKSTRYIRRGTC